LMLRRLQDRVAIVTGAARGIGRAVARAYAAEGAHVIAVDRIADDTSRARPLNSSATLNRAATLNRISNAVSADCATQASRRRNKTSDSIDLP
ncbi:MAG: SDR family NAD(P)-dependent oxidoreductase, partial [Planctomycetota bacterium]